MDTDLRVRFMLVAAATELWHGRFPRGGVLELYARHADHGQIAVAMRQRRDLRVDRRAA